MSEYAVNPVIPSDNALLSATLNQQLTPAPHAYVVATETSQPQPVYGQPMANGQPQYGQSAHVQPDQSQYFQPVLVIGAGNGILDAQGVPNAQTVMTSAGMVTVGMFQPIGVKCTSGLEYMSALSKIWIKEMPQLIEQFTNFEANQKFQCLNSEGQQVYWSQENTGSCTRQCLGASRPFHIDIHTPSGQIAMQLDRPFRCNSVCILGCLPLNFCFLQDLAVTDSAGDVIGHVIQKASLRPFFDLIDDCGTVLCHIDGPWMMNCCSSFSDVVFNIYEPNTTENPVGTLTKKWGGFIRESLLSNADNFACVFPTKISVSGKALIFATTFLIDFMYFEDKKKKKRGAVEH